MTTAEIVIAWIAVWDRRLAELKPRLDAWDNGWRDGWQAAWIHAETRYEAGYNDARMALKSAQHDIVRLARDEAAITAADEIRWGPGGRAHFADPRPGDYPGGPVAPW